MTPRRQAITVAVLAAIATTFTAGCGSSSPSGSGAAATITGPAGTGSAGLGTVIRRQVPAALRELPLTDQAGKRVDLASWPGRTVLLVPFLTLCQDICPLTTGNLLAVQQSLVADHAGDKVQIVELTVDPHRDTPARLAAYGRLSHASWQLVTETPADLRRLARFFGFYYKRTAEDAHAARDWWTGKPLTYDVDHSDNYFVIDPSGVERVVQDAAPEFHGQLNPKLYRFLDALGRQHLSHPAQLDWTPTAALDALGLSVGVRLPLSTGG